MGADLHSQRTVAFNLEVTREDMQRYVAQLESDKA